MVLKWLLPIGLLGLLGLVLLVLIYIFKPQFSDKKISSTVVWRRVLLKNRKKIPINIFQNILVFLLQALAITLLALSLAKPHLFNKSVLLMNSEHIIIIDASASMTASPKGGDSRFDMAKKLIKDEIDEIFKDDMGTVSVIYADSEPKYIVDELTRISRDEAKNTVDGLKCSFGSADLEEALNMAEEELKANPYAKISLYTDTQFGNMGSAITVHNLSDAENEWNVAILGCRSNIRDNEYVFDITVASYGNVALKLDMKVEIKGAMLAGEEEPKNYTLTVPLTIESGSDLMSEQTITVCATDADYGGKDEWYYESYEEVQISFNELEDSMTEDNSFTLYGGKRDNIFVQYWSGAPNIFWQLGFATMTNNLYRDRIITYTEVYTENGQVAVNKGYDVYIFEHGMAQIALPEDGIIILSDPGAAASQVGISVGSKVRSTTAQHLNTEASHPLLNYIDVSNIVVTEYTKMDASKDPTFLPILFCGDDPIMFVKNTPEQKIVVMAFSINMSSFYETEFQIFLYNLLNYFMPISLSDYECSVGESLTVNCKGVGMTVEDESGEISEVISYFPANYKFTNKGTYTFVTKLLLKKTDEVKKVYVHMPPEESSLFAVSNFRYVLDNKELTGEVGTDIFLYLAIALLLLMLIEWCLQFKEIL